MNHNSVTKSNAQVAPETVLPAAGLTLATTKPSDKGSSIVHTIDVDSFELGLESVLKATTLSNNCKGHILIFPDGKSPHTCYPFALHDTIILPWDYMTQNSIMTLFSWSCMGKPEGSFESCRACRNLAKTDILQGIVDRIQDGVHETVGFAYHGFGGLCDLLRRKNRQIDFHRFRSLNQARKLLSKATALSDQKRLLMAVASGKVNRVDRVLSMGLRQKKGVRGLLAVYFAAADGIYAPKTFTEEEDMKAILTWRLGGNRLAQINHNANGAQSIAYLRSRSTVPPIIPSHAQPTIEQVQKNVEATLEGVLDEIHGRMSRTVLHTVLMFDELATEKRIRWDPKTNHFLGVCREHAHVTSMEFVNEGDMEELFRLIDAEKLHYAGEVIDLVPFGILLPSE
jgi:hypothetical protein